MKNLFLEEEALSREEKINLKGHKPTVVWFTGLSGAGKSTLAKLLEKELFKRSVHTCLLDGDNIRSGLNCNLHFTEEDRTENLRRVAEVAKLFLESGIVVISAFITPLASDRQLIKDIVGEENFLEIFVSTSLEECEKRDVKGLYQKARAGEITNFTGISAPYEKPVAPDVEVSTEDSALEVEITKILEIVESRINTGWN
ncbi:adenylyl-sulfate kinase [Zunongwangia sp. F363]|uniref:Adenylyl-sulfate kinase n=1 Tax=Autumnicola tepida TaxID=3075595 RepID=A0ABU3C7I0_9FLAO|nr:adenylyl-sulfate kinase [Zunongwangia sp. F363]MDT0642296.1 adenylyl-sulfate kinase [Zunongwangia sp. F363]